ncbi:RES family NAD+ phosphorylase [Pedobacter montanisoli]|uniref:RES family NAD+ phosphorylase n=1 Tax=Pedobacter montanisoli TaxID=2923277 RepID=A0ABS9ZVZ7_9SPHI|nr:RES family NAD+ phosphorylase [Pedobacter montanisoli]MCJ0742485.1 RES family NAD+ phosphorylase [Pedobacter montanisoli]
MILYRISSPAFTHDLSGTGAKLYGGRWNEKGVPALYLASSRAMAVMEVLVHLSQRHLVRSYNLAAIEIPEDKIYFLDVGVLNCDWKQIENEGSLKRLGTSFLEKGDFLAMRVPSVLVEEEYNYVINPNHIDARKIKILNVRPFFFDQRLKM